MNFSPDALLGYLNKQDGLSRKNRYEVIVSFPGGVTSDIGGSDLNLICESAVMPGLRISTADRTELRQSVKVPYTFSVEEAEFGFLLDGNYKAKEAFDDWMNLIVDSATHALKYKKEIVADWRIYQLTTNNERTSGMKLWNVFPIEVSKVDFSNTAKNELQTFTVTVAYDKHTPM